MITYIGLTLVDISQNKSKDELSIKQQKNLNVLSQVLNLRTQIYNLTVTKKSEELTSKFGVNYSGIGNYWEFRFDVEFEDVFLLNGNRYGILDTDLHLVPIITNLTETEKIEPFFLTSSPNKNISISFLG